MAETEALPVATPVDVSSKPDAIDVSATPEDVTESSEVSTTSDKEIEVTIPSLSKSSKEEIKTEVKIKEPELELE